MQSRWRTSLIWLLALFLSVNFGCSDVQRDALPKDAVILAFGDSLTAGKGVEMPHSYPSVLTALSGRQVVNEGRSGETTAEGLQRFAAALDRTTPNLVILMHGGNDILRNYDLAQTKQNLAAMIELAQRRGASVLLVGVPKKSLFVSCAPMYKELAATYDLLFEERIVSKLLKDSAMKSDLIHFNRAGYAALAAQLDAVLRDAGMVR